MRAYPRTGGKDLARGTVATSSGDETADFPASAATDGNPRTRWSSTAEDGAWLQFALAHPDPPGPARPELAGRLRRPLPRPGLAGRPQLAHGGHGAGRQGRPRVRPDGRQGRPVRPHPGRQAGHPLRLLAVVGGGVRGDGARTRAQRQRATDRRARPSSTAAADAGEAGGVRSGRSGPHHRPGRKTRTYADTASIRARASSAPYGCKYGSQRGSRWPVPMIRHASPDGGAG